MMQMKALSECRVNARTTEAFLQRLLTYPASTATGRTAMVVNGRAVNSVQALFAGRGKGSNLASAAGTAWGLVNSVTEFVDHHRRTRSEDHRRDAAWFGHGAQIKQKAWNEVIKLVA